MEYLTKLKTGQEVINFDKLEKTGFPFILIISERSEKGKTFGGKEHILKHYKKFGDKGMWIRNKLDQIELEAPRFLNMNKAIYPARWKDVEMKGWGTYYRQDKQPFIEFIPLGKQADYKGSRDRIKIFVYDEFNEGLRMIGNQQAYLLLNLISTFEHPKGSVCFIFGNYKSLNTPLLVSFKVFTIKKEITKIYDENGKPLLFIYVPRVNKIKVAEKKKTNSLYQMSKLTGDVGHIFENESSLDDLNGVIEMDTSKMKYTQDYLIGGRYYRIGNYKNLKNEINYYAFNIETPKRDIVVLSKKELKNNYRYSTNTRKQIFNLISLNKIFFDSIVSREAFVSHVS